MKFEYRPGNTRALEDVGAVAERRFTKAIRWPGDSVVKIVVTARDCNGPKGGIDKVCRVFVWLTKARRLVLEDGDASVHAALARLAERTSRAVHRALDANQRRYLLRCYSPQENQG